MEEDLHPSARTTTSHLIAAYAACVRQESEHTLCPHLLPVSCSPACRPFSSPETRDKHRKVTATERFERMDMRGDSGRVTCLHRVRDRTCELTA